VIIHASLSLVYDVSAFPVIIYSARNRGLVRRTMGAPSILENIVRDATSYFLVMLIGHLLLVLFELFAPEPIQLLPSCANAVLIPMMVTRLMLSLRKAAVAPDSTWSLSGTTEQESAKFARDTTGTERGGGDIRLRDVSAVR